MNKALENISKFLFKVLRVKAAARQILMRDEWIINANLTPLT